MPLCRMCGYERPTTDMYVFDDGIICKDCYHILHGHNEYGDNVSHPNHYQGSNGMETIDVIKNFTSDISGFQAVCTGNIIKYITRWHKKNGLEDLRKAQKYLEWLIKEVEDNGQN